MAADGFRGQRCMYRSRLTTLRHNSIEKLLHDTVREGIGHAYRQEHNLPAADRTVPDLVIYLDSKPILCDVTVVDPLADSNLNASTKGPDALPKAAAEKVAKYRDTEVAMGAKHLPFAVESMGGLSESAQQLIREIHRSVR